MYQIVLPEVKPALEWVNGRVLQKLSPPRRHSLAQTVFLVALGRWADENRCGWVGCEWEFRLQPPGEIRRPLVPDIAYLSYARAPYEDDEASEIPYIAPDAVVEVLLPADRQVDIDDKVRVYFACGALVIFLVNTTDQTITALGKSGQQVFRADEIIGHPSLPGFALRAHSLFKEIPPKRPAVE
jgi:Uma2 family endonuclease